MLRWFRFKLKRAHKRSIILYRVTYFGGILMSKEINSPHIEDVISGNASYVESYYVINNDTIKTYKIVWKQKN
jgi:hypothetical protein